MAINFHDSPIPRYLQLADLMRQRIARGQWGQGHRLPSLEGLVAEFGVARVTVRQAIDVLTREGLVSPQQGRGTFVTGLPPNDRWLQVQTTLAELAKVYRDTKPKIVNIDETITNPPLTAQDGVAAERYVYMRRVHEREGRPYCVINIYLDEQIFRRDPVRYRNETVIPLLVSDPALRIARAHQVLTIGTADMEVAGHLQVPVNTPIAEVRRLFLDEAGKVVYLSEVSYRGDFIHLEMNLIP
ncbi:GntR family transcriptional regulator [Bordetella bronchiseptica]|uniref:GntR family transcriptional regulator n=1 Tax=Bordetella bronchiseptica TaxID=518 RepID=UPI00028A97AC|nr:GntR family transcriptional regulator [Bordetella bronchiseptica]KCV32398.1 UbiC transcription regulator-associated domain protein [Bordetella bronchiseptica 00-P-2730]AWP58971.1 GntR family transcriptional regulator [Bordetella bronchiseptica]AWQ05718.1 GntR family transcriptional regulator [Bordetella bronchiseptica]AZW31286.1 GntR family transcriptional regulator [Bordetella bronchiseptica]KAK53036.1 UbiC transcription regulator-associated domain protein [Bordetella bronchiseptica OSU054